MGQKCEGNCGLLVLNEIIKIPRRWLKVAILKLPLPLLLLQTAIMEIHAILKAQTDAAAASSNLLINRLEEVAGFRGSGSWIPEAAACTLLIRYIRENFKIPTFSCLSGIIIIIGTYV